MAPMLAAAGVKTWAGLVRNAAFATISDRADAVAVTLFEKKGSGFLYPLHGPETLPAGDFGAAVATVKRLLTSR